MPLSIKRMRGSPSHVDLRNSPARKEISLPVSLISTTNMLSYEAPDLVVARQMMAARSSSDDSTPTPSSPSTVPSLTPDGSSAGSSPAVEYNHLSAYFPGPTVKRTASARQNQLADADAPAIPKRVPSHSKREHERLARKRSLQNSGRTSPATSPSSPDMGPVDGGAQRTSLELMGVNAPEPPPKMTSNPTRHRSPTATANPFSPELEKLNEVVEDFKNAAEDANTELEDDDTMHMRKFGLVRFAAVDYRNDIGSCYPRAPFNVGFTPQDNAGGWI